MKKYSFILFISSILILSAVFYYKHISELSKDTEENAMSRGNSIIEALDSYHNDYCYYPKKLNELVPKYIKKIPTPKLSNGLVPAKFYYRRTDDQFYLSFRYDIFSELYYKSDKREWTYANH